MPEPIDPSGFNMFAQLVVADSGGTFPLWMRGSEDISGAEFGEEGIFRGTDRNWPDLPILQSVEMELNLGLNGKINIEIGAPYDLGLALLESQLFTIGNTIQVQLGYPKISRFTPWFSGMNAKPSLRIDPDNGLSATLNIEGAGFAALRSSSSEPFQNQTYQQIIQTIADRHDWEVLGPGPSQAASGEPDPYTATRVTVSQGNRSDFLFLQQVVSQAQLDFTLGPHPDRSGVQAITLYRREETTGRRPKYIFVARGQSNFINVFPLFSFESQAEGVWLPRGTGLLRTCDIDPTDRSEAMEEADQSSSTIPATAPRQAGDGSQQVGDQQSRVRRPADAQTSGEWYAASARDPMTPLERLRSYSTEQAMRGGITGNMSSFGIPDLVPGDVIRIEELGVFSGNYGVQGVTHRAAAGEWTMTMQLLSNAAAVTAMAAHLQQEPPSFNDEEPEESSEAEGAGQTRTPEAADTGP